MHFSTTLSVTALLCLLSCASAAVFSSKAVIQPSGVAAIRSALKSEKATLLAATAPWCGHCVKLGPAFDQAAKSLEGIVNFIGLDCDAKENQPWCGEIGVKGFPTLKFFPGGSAPSQDYQGERTAKAMSDFVTSRMPTFVKSVGSAAELDSLTEKAATSSKITSLLFTSAKKVTPLYKALSTDFHRSLDFFAARDEKIGKEALEKYGVAKVPALVVLKGSEKIVYDGPLKYANIKKFLDGFTATAKKPKKSDKAKDEL